MICNTCGKAHDIPHISFTAPHYWLDRFADQEDCHLDDDLCVIQEQDFFLRGVVQIPVIDSDEVFGWNLWISQKRENFECYRDQFTSADIGPFFGWVSNAIPFYQESTLNLRSRAVFRGNGLRPLIEIAPCEHELYLHTQHGISRDKIHLILHSL